MKKLGIIIFVFILAVSNLSAQQNCSENLRTAERYFDEGLLDEIPDLLSKCIKNGFSKEEKLDAYKLMVQTYIYNDEYEKADVLMLEFLGVFPEYEVTESDSREFADLHKTYQTEPVFQFEVSGGANFTNIFINEYFGLHDLSNQTVTYSSNPGIYFRFSYQDRIFDLFDISGGLSFSQVNYSYVLDYNGIYNEFTTLSGDFTNMYVGLPISLSYVYPIFNLYPYVKAGFETTYLFSSKVDFTRTFTEGAYDDFFKNINLNEYRKDFDIRPFLEIGVGYKIGKSIIKLSTGVKTGTINPVFADKHYQLQQELDNYRLYYEDDHILPFQYYVTFSYVFSIYKPIKISQ